MALAVTELQPFLAAGGTALVDCTGAGIGTNPAAVRAIAQQTGLHIVQGTGLHIELNHPEWVWAMGLHEVAERFARDVTDGIGASGVNVNYIAPGYMAADINAKFREQPGQYDWIRRRTPQDLMGAAVFLAGEASAFMTGDEEIVSGEEVTVDGEVVIEEEIISEEVVYETLTSEETAS